MKSDSIVEKLSTHIHKEIIEPIQIDADALALIDSWRDFLSSWTMVSLHCKAHFLLLYQCLVSRLVQATVVVFTECLCCERTTAKFDCIAGQQQRRQIYQNHKQTVESFASYFVQLEDKFNWISEIWWLFGKHHWAVQQCHSEQGRHFIQRTCLAEHLSAEDSAVLAGDEPKSTVPSRVPPTEQFHPTDQQTAGRCEGKVCRSEFGKETY